MITKEQITLALIKSLNQTYPDGYEISASDANNLFYELEGEHLGLTFLEVEKYSAGDGHPMWKVFEVTSKDTEDKTYIKFEGVYSSWDSTVFDDGYEIVEPYTEPVRKWKKA